LLTGRVDNGSITGRGKHGKVAGPLLALLGRTRVVRAREARQARPVPIEVSWAGSAGPRVKIGRKRKSRSGRAQLQAGFRSIAK
jgi:hypothetical protein